MLLDEKLLPGPDAIEKVTRQRPHYSQFFRWTEVGLKTPDGHRVRLEFVKAGRKRLTSTEAVRRFFAMQTEAVCKARRADISSQVEQGIDAADLDAELNRAGL
jgi:hypothetical protein